MKPLWIGLKNTFTQIKNRKVYFTFLIILQILLLVSISGVILFFGVKMIANVNDITASLDKSIGDTNGKVSQDQALQQAYGLLTTYNLLKQNFIYLLIVLVIIYLTLQSLIWIFSHQLFDSYYNLHKMGWKKRLYLFFKLWLYCSFTSILISPFFLIIKLTLNSRITQMGLIITYLILQPFVWLEIYQLAENNFLNWKKKLCLFFQQWLKYTFSSLILIIPLFLIIYFALNRAISMSVSPDSFTFLLRVLFYLSVPLYFVLITTFASINTLSWKKYFQQIWFLLTKKIYYCLLLFVVQIIILGMVLTPVYFTMANESLFNLSLVMIFIFNVILVLSRLWWISSLQELSKDMNEKNNVKK